MKTFFKSFYEYKKFSDDRPWSVIRLRPPDEDGGIRVTPPHYADTVELVLTEGIAGNYLIGCRQFEFAERNVLCAAPNVVHAMNYMSGSGSIVCMKVYPDGLRRFINIEAVLENNGASLDTLYASNARYSEIKRLADRLEDEGLRLTDGLSAILELFGCLTEDGGQPKISEYSGSLKNSELREIIRWTEEHIAERITLDAVSARLGYNKNYFCSKFKNAVGATYVSYLNTLRVSRACAMLGRGMTINDTCEACGFENVSYFINLFRRITGTTPGKYLAGADRK